MSVHGFFFLSMFSSGFHQLCAVNYTLMACAERTVAKVTSEQLMSEQSRPVMNSKFS